MEESKHEDDSEMPDEYNSEEDDSSDSEGELSNATSSSMSSMLVSPGGPQESQKKTQYPMEEIDRIIKEAKEQKRKLMDMASEGESSMSESGFDQRYL